MCVLIFSTTFVWNISQSWEKWARYDKKTKVYWSSYKAYASPILMKNWIFSKDFLKQNILKYQISLKSVQKVYWSSYKAPICLSDFYEKLNFLERFSKK